MDRFKIAVQQVTGLKPKKIPLESVKEEEMTNIVMALWGLPYTYRKRVKTVIRLCYYSGAQNAATIMLSGKFTPDELLDECKKQLDKGSEN